MAEIIIYLDMDGVFTRWEDYADAAAKAQGIPADKLSDFYHTLDEDWWATIPAYDGARAFYDSVKAIGPSRVKFLTGVKLNPGCFSGKAIWLQNFIPERGLSIMRDYLPCSSGDKDLQSQPGRILVDDRIENITAWEKKGGTGIHHKGDYADTLRRLQEAVARLNNPAPQGGLPPRFNGPA